MYLPYIYRLAQLRLARAQHSTDSSKAVQYQRSTAVQYSPTCGWIVVWNRVVKIYGRKSLPLPRHLSASTPHGRFLHCFTYRIQSNHSQCACISLRRPQRHSVHSLYGLANHRNFLDVSSVGTHGQLHNSTDNIRQRRQRSVCRKIVRHIFSETLKSAALTTSSTISISPHPHHPKNPTNITPTPPPHPHPLTRTFQSLLFTATTRSQPTSFCTVSKSAPSSLCGSERLGYV